MQDQVATVKQDRKAAVAALEVLGGKLQAEEDIIFRGRQYVLPENSDLHTAVRALSKQLEAEETHMAFSHIFEYRPWDGARATAKALKKAFGLMQSVPTPGMFGSTPPQMRSIPSGVGETEQVPWGDIVIPDFPGLTLTLTGTVDKDKGELFALVGEGPRKYRFVVDGIFKLVEEYLATDSLYRGKAFDGQSMPEFIDVSTVDPSKVVYSDDVMEQLEANVWSIIEHTQANRDAGLPIKRAVLFEGPYGTGKTLAATLTAQRCLASDEQWTFIACRPGQDRPEDVMATASLYQPSCVFIEDVDTFASGDSGGVDHVAKLLDTFDGARSKGVEIIVVLTTNHAETIHKGMVRPGRLDAVIHIGALDVHGVQRMAEAVIADGLLAHDIDWERVGLAADGFMPAFVKEGCDRAVRYNLARNRGRVTTINTDDLVNAMLGLRPQLELMEGASETLRRPTLDKVVVDLMDEAAAGVMNRSNMTNRRGNEASYEFQTEEVN